MKARKSLSSNSQLDYGQIPRKIMVFLIFSILVSAQYPIENFTTAVAESSQTGQTCFTQPCLFPFSYKDRTFNECTLFEWGDKWCAIKVYDNGTVKHWKYCSVTNKPCLFPFNYNGKTFNECTLFQADNEWCATEVYVNHTMKRGAWGYCGIDCRKGQGIIMI